MRYLLTLILLGILPSSSLAECKGHSCNDGGMVTTEVPVSVESTVNSQYKGGKAIALGAGDMDINDYYRSYGVAWGAWQGTHPNPLAVAKDLAIEGRYEEAAILRCSVKAVYRAFGGKESCIKRLGTPPVETPMPEPAVVVTEDDDDEIRQLKEEIEQLKQQPVIEQRIVEQRPFLTDKQRAALQEVINE